MKLRLNDIPADGQEFTFNQKTGEMTPAIKDLVGQNDYELTVFIKPLNHRDYEMKGILKAKTSELCSLCGENFAFPIKTKLNEILIPAEPEEKDLEKQSRSNHFSELDNDGPSVSEYEDGSFDIGEYTHQLIGLTVPFNPKPCIKENGDCEVCLKPNMNKPIRYDEDMTKFEAEKQKQNPFNVLKNIKPN